MKVTIERQDGEVISYDYDLMVLGIMQKVEGDEVRVGACMDGTFTTYELAMTGLSVSGMCNDKIHEIADLEGAE